jgi:hypothetical protein
LMFWLASYAAAGDQYFFDDVILAKVVAGPPVITAQPSNQTVAPGQTATFSVTASESLPLSYQWYRDGGIIAGANSASYTTPATTLADNNASFTCLVSNSAGSVTSNPAILTVQAAAASLLLNPGFETGTGPWVFYTNTAGSFDNNSPGPASLHSGHIAITQAGANIQLLQAGITLEPNTKYRLSFLAYTNTGHDVSVSLMKNASPYTNYGLSEYVCDLNSSGYGACSVEFTTPGFAGTVNDGRLMFWLASYATAGDQYFFDEVMLVKQ